MIDNETVIKKLKEISDKLEANSIDTRDVKVCLLGDLAKPGMPGLITRIDRLEREAEKTKWFTRAAIGAAIAAAIASAKGLFK